MKTDRRSKESRMKSRLNRLSGLMVMFALGLPVFGEGLSLTVAPGETVSLTSHATYDTITVRGTLNISNGAKIAVTNVFLGPEPGDAAVINVMGDTTTFGDAKVTTIVIGQNGGSGKLVGPDDGREHVDIWSQVWAFAYNSLTVSANAALGADGYIDIMDLKKSATAGGAIVNLHPTGVARITATGNVRFGGQQRWGGTFFTGKILVEQKTAGKGVFLGPRYAPQTLAPADTGLVFQNVAAVTVAGVGKPANLSEGKVTVHPGVDWGGSDLVVQDLEVGFTATVNDVFPYGPGKGSLKLLHETASVYLNATVQHLNGLMAHQGRSATNGYAVTGKAGAKLIFGSGDTDGSLSGAVDPVVALEKTGSGTLFVTNPLTATALSVTDGALHFAAPAVLDTLTVAEGATVIVDGISVTTRVNTVSGTLTCLNGGRLVSVITAETDARVADFSSAVPFVKAGDGTLILENPAAIPDDIKVEAGTLAFSARGYTIPLYRFSCTRWMPNSSVARFAFKRFALVGADGLRTCTGLTYRAPGTLPAALQPGEVTVPDGYQDHYSYWTAEGIFAQAQDSSRLDIRSPVLTNATEDAILTDEMSFTFAPHVDDKPAVAYNWAPAWTGRPIDWSMKGSFDGGETWITLDTWQNYKLTAYIPDNKWVDGTDVGPQVPPVFPLYTTDPRAAAPGATGLPEQIALEVAEGARADFGNVTGGQRVNALTVKCAGAGSVSNIVFADSGVLEIQTTESGESVGIGSVLPLTIEGASGLENLNAWQVRVDGVTLKAKLALQEGHLTLTPFGMALIIR